MKKIIRVATSVGEFTVHLDLDRLEWDLIDGPDLVETEEGLCLPDLETALEIDEEIFNQLNKGVFNGQSH